MPLIGGMTTGLFTPTEGAIAPCVRDEHPPVALTAAGVTAEIAAWVSSSCSPAC